MNSADLLNSVASGLHVLNVLYKLGTLAVYGVLVVLAISIIVSGCRAFGPRRMRML